MFAKINVFSLSLPALAKQFALILTEHCLTCYNIFAYCFLDFLSASPKCQMCLFLWWKWH